jgi:hypothetical protein
MILRIFSLKLTPQEWLLMLFCIAVYPVSLHVPPSWGWEDGPIENAQVAVLLAGCVWAALISLRSRHAPLAALARCAAPLWLVLTARELSWGAVFMHPLGYSDEGPVFSSSLLWYKPLVMPAIALVLAWMAYAAWRHRLDRLLIEIVIDGRFPWLPALVVTLCMLGSGCAEGHVECGIPFHHLQAEVFEELTELIAYLGLFVGQANVLNPSQTCLNPTP